MAAIATDSFDPANPDDARRARESCAEPGMVMAFAAGQPYCSLIPLGETPLPLGRGEGILGDHADALMSRRHASLWFRAGCFHVEDLASRNGSAVDGVPLQGRRTVPGGSLVRLGGSLFLLCSDLRPFRQLGITTVEQRVQGPATTSLLRTAAQIAGASRTLFISGESGAGKESLAQTFHKASPQREGPFIAVNCAAIPEGIAERLLFGARKGAFSGVVSDSEGYIEAANGGTLFLDEVADLDAVVQGKLLRVIETGELLPLGATRPRKVQFRVCTATHKDLRALTQEGKFRADLYFRIGMPQLAVPPLRERREEIPWMMHAALGAVLPGLKLHVSIVETCMLRTWPGNVRELLAETHSAALKARAADSALVHAEHLGTSAGKALSAPAVAPVARAVSVAASEPPAPTPLPQPAASDAPLDPPEPGAPPSLAQILAALFSAKGNVSAAARALRIHRTQLRRLLTRHKINAEKLRDLEGS